jgi:hypothetical protein
MSISPDASVFPNPDTPLQVHKHEIIPDQIQYLNQLWEELGQAYASTNPNMASNLEVFAKPAKNFMNMYMESNWARTATKSGSMEHWIEKTYVNIHGQKKAAIKVANDINMEVDNENRKKHSKNQVSAKNTIPNSSAMAPPTRILPPINVGLPKPFKNPNKIVFPERQTFPSVPVPPQTTKPNKEQNCKSFAQVAKAKANKPLDNKYLSNDTMQMALEMKKAFPKLTSKENLGSALDPQNLKEKKNLNNPKNQGISKGPVEVLQQYTFGKLSYPYVERTPISISVFQLSLVRLFPFFPFHLKFLELYIYLLELHSSYTALAAGVLILRNLKTYTSVVNILC